MAPVAPAPTMPAPRPTRTVHGPVLAPPDRPPDGRAGPRPGRVPRPPRRLPRPRTEPRRRLVRPRRRVRPVLHRLRPARPRRPRRTVARGCVPGGRLPPRHAGDADDGHRLLLILVRVR